MDFNDIFDLDPARLDKLAAADLVDDASRILLCLLRELAGSEALVRALVAERRQQRAQARFWVEVYLKYSAETST